ncbi:MAG: glycosyltransferase family 25 protein [Halioglobus sp.]
MQHYMQPLIQNTICIGLAERTDRREHAKAEFDRVGIDEFIWVDAFGTNSDKVRDAYESGVVAGCPPCFRCGQNKCECENKRLIETQVGAWLSHFEAWSHVAQRGLSLICEDDIQFTERATEGFDWLNQQPDLLRAVELQQPTLLRLGKALTQDHISNEDFQLTTDITMSNPCYALNSAMAQLLLESGRTVTTTVDIYTHRLMNMPCSHHTLFPPIAYEHSWSTGQLRSDIRPKEVYISRLERQLAQLESYSDEYKAIVLAIEDERKRFRKFERDQRFD